MSAEYDWLEPREHVKKRPDTYVGPVSVTTIHGHAFYSEHDKIKSKDIQCTTSPALFKMFDEVIVNAIDNSKRDSTQKYIKAYFSEGTFKVENDGATIPIKFWEGTERYVAEILVYELMSGQNFKDMRDMVGGRNGLGLKIVNILSEEFEVLIVNVEEGKKYHQKFSKNADQVGTPKISKITAKDKKSSTTIICKPDYERLGVKLPLEDNFIEMIKTRVYDAAACTSPTVSTYFNGEKLSIKNMKDYISAFGGDWIGKEEIKVNGTTVFEFCMSRARKADNERGKCIGFVNGLQCSLGTHVDLVYKRVIEYINDLCKKKLKRACSVRPQQIKDALIIVINASFPNPSFSSQTKDKCDLRTDKFGFQYNTISNEFAKMISKCGLVDDILNSLQEQEDKEVSKSVQQTKRQKQCIPKYQRALKSHANLYITEGDSAMAMALSGFSVIGRDHNGVFPLRGKLVNVHGMKAKTALEHKEIMHLTQILQLEPNKVYDGSNMKQLPYRHIVIFTDQDHDGSHIMGLIMTFIREFFPSILQIWPDFVQRFATHIVKAKIGTETKSFFSLQEYKNWCGNQKPSWVKYYKGLGTSTDEEAVEYFENIQNHLTEIQYTGEESDDAINVFYASDKSDKRKDILQSMDAATFVNYKLPKTTFEEFCYNELIHHCAADNIRSIACGIDGLKPSQRKILHTANSNKSGEIKVASLAAKTVDTTAYHHGEASLISAIMMMAQKHVGTNNIAYLSPNGQFGSRLTKRDDGLAAPRYVFTEPAPITKFMFRPEDSKIIKYAEDDGMMIEPVYFVPVVANILINGCEGIGTGYKTSIPSFNPLDVIKITKQYINDPMKVDEIIPYYHGFKGTTTVDSTGNIIFTGTYVINNNKNEMHITELPPKVWSGTYFDWLLKNLPEYITEIEQKSSKVEVLIIVKYKSGTDILEKNIVEDFKLSQRINLNQMNLFDRDNNLVKYSSIYDIIKDHADVRISTYKKRLVAQITETDISVGLFKEKARFLQECVDKTIIVAGKSQKDLKSLLEAKNYIPHDNFRYLTSMEIYSQTKEEVEKMKLLAENMDKKLRELKKMTPEKLWLQELHELENEYYEYLKPKAKSKTDEKRKLSSSSSSSKVKKQQKTK